MARYPRKILYFSLDVLYNDRQGTIAMLEYISGEKINDRALEFMMSTHNSLIRSLY